MFLPCLAKQQRKVRTDPTQCRVMQWCTTQCTGFCKLRRFTAMSATWCISCAPFFRRHLQPSPFYCRHHTNANYAGSEWGSGGAYVAHHSIDKRGNTKNPEYYVHWQPICSVFIHIMLLSDKSYQDLEKFKALRIVVRIGSGVDNIDVKVSWCSILSVLPVIVLLALGILYSLSTITYSSGCRGNGYCCVQCARLWRRGGSIKQTSSSIADR